MQASAFIPTLTVRRQVCSFKDVVVGHLLPLDVSEASEAEHLKCVEFAFLVSTKSLGLAAIQEGAQHTSSVRRL